MAFPAPVLQLSDDVLWCEVSSGSVHVVCGVCRWLVVVLFRVDDFGLFVDGIAWRLGSVDIA